MGRMYIRKQPDEEGNPLMDEWRDHKNLVLHELQRMNDNIEKLFDSHVEQREELATIKGKATILGAISGIVISGLVVLLEWLLNK